MLARSSPEQFAPGQKERVQGYFAIYYFTVNIGSLLSMIITPKVRKENKECKKERKKKERTLLLN